jgi:hypothetical protein
MPITDFKDWLKLLGPRTIREIYFLYKSVYDIDEVGCFKTTQVKNRNRWKVACFGVPTQLLLASESARETFLYHLNKNYSCGMGSVELCYKSMI